MMGVLNAILNILILIAAFAFAAGSTILVAEKKARYRAGTHDYYDNPIID